MATPAQRHFQRFVERTAVRLARRLTLNLIEDTPKDTTLAARSWIPARGLAMDMPPRAPSARIARATHVPAQAAKQAAGLLAITRFRWTDRFITIHNGQHYIGALNDGHSSQAPRMFIQRSTRRSILETVRGIRA